MSQDIQVVKDRAVFAPSQEDYKEMQVGEPQNMLEVRALADYLSRSKFIPQSFRGDISTAVMLIVTCKQYGLPITALSEVMEVNGKVGFWGRTKLGIVLKSPVCEYIMATEQTDKKCTVETQRKGWPKPVSITYTLDQAEKAGLLARSDAWKKHPADMLYWRAVSRIISQVYPDVIQGFATVEEAMDEDAQQLQQAQAVVMPQEMAKPKRARKIKAAEVQEPIVLDASVEAEYKAEEPIAEAAKDEQLFEAPEQTEEPAAKAESLAPKRLVRFVKQVLIEGGVRYVVAQNPVVSTMEEKYVVPSLAMAGELKKLTGMKVYLFVQDNTVVSYEQYPEQN